MRSPSERLLFMAYLAGATIPSFRGKRQTRQAYKQDVGRERERGGTPQPTVDIIEKKELCPKKKRVNVVKIKRNEIRRRNLRAKFYFVHL